MCAANCAVVSVWVSAPTNVEPSAIEVPMPIVRAVSPVGRVVAAPVCTPTGDLDLKSGSLTVFVPHDGLPEFPQLLLVFKRLKRF